jgi:hypothetical protein
MVEEGKKEPSASNVPNANPNTGTSTNSYTCTCNITIPTGDYCTCDRCPVCGKLIPPKYPYYPYPYYPYTWPWIWYPVTSSGTYKTSTWTITSSSSAPNSFTWYLNSTSGTGSGS